MRRVRRRVEVGTFENVMLRVLRICGEEETGTIWDVKAWLWRFGNQTGGDDKPKNWHRTKEHGIVTFIVTRLE
jgi:hypothetical protein